MILDWIKEWEFWIALVSLVGGIFAIFKYRESKKQQDFENYHKLVERLNKSTDNNNISLQIQQAAIFELRNYKRYKNLTIKLLEFWKSEKSNKDLIDAANDTLKFLEKK